MEVKFSSTQLMQVSDKLSELDNQISNARSDLFNAFDTLMLENFMGDSFSSNTGVSYQNPNGSSFEFVNGGSLKQFYEVVYDFYGYLRQHTTSLINYINSKKTSYSQIDEVAQEELQEVLNILDGLK